MISPAGTAIVLYTSGLDSAVVSLTGLIAGQVPGPFMAGMGLLFIQQGIQVAKGNPEPMRDLPLLFLRFALVFWLITSPETYLYYVRDVFLTGFPAALISAATGWSGTSVATPTGMGLVLNGMWAQGWDASAQIGRTLVPTDPSTWVTATAGFYAAWFYEAGVWCCAMVYVNCEYFKTLVVIIGPVMIACWPIKPLKHLALAWKGVAISLCLAEVLAFLTLEVAMLANQPLMAKLTEAMVTTLTQPAAVQDALVDLVAMGFVVWVAAGAAVVVPGVSFFIGRGGGAPQPIVLQPARG